MTTVPKADTPPPANNATTYTISGSAGMYGRPAMGGFPVAGKQEGNPAGGDAPAGAIPIAPVSGTVKQFNPDGSVTQLYPGNPGTFAGAPVSKGNPQVGPDMGHGATQIVAEPDASGAPETATDGGTVGTSQTP